MNTGLKGKSLLGTPPPPLVCSILYVSHVVKRRGVANKLFPVRNIYTIKLFLKAVTTCNTHASHSVPPPLCAPSTCKVKQTCTPCTTCA